MTNADANMRKARTISAVTTFAVMTFVSGFFTALVFALAVFLTAHLSKFRFVLPKAFCDAGGYPAYWAENLLPVGIMGFIALLFFIIGHSFAALILCVAAVMDLMRNRFDFIGFFRSKINGIHSKEQ